jgi:hypothetical protein
MCAFVQRALLSVGTNRWSSVRPTRVEVGKRLLPTGFNRGRWEKPIMRSAKGEATVVDKRIKLLRYPKFTLRYIAALNSYTKIQ